MTYPEMGVSSLCPSNDRVIELRADSSTLIPTGSGGSDDDDGKEENKQKEQEQND